MDFSSDLEKMERMLNKAGIVFEKSKDERLVEYWLKTYTSRVCTFEDGHTRLSLGQIRKL